MEEPKKWRNIEPEVWKPSNDSTVLTGVLISKVPKEENMGARYYIENRSGRHIVFGSAILDSKMEFVNIGQKVRIAYKGKTEGKSGQVLNNFTVAVPVTSEPVL